MGRQLTPPSYYYNYEFLSPEPLFAEIREEMRSYFDTGVVDDTMFPLYTEKALKKLGRVAYKIDEVLLELADFSACLPADFSFVREVWALADMYYSVPSPTAIYTQQTCVVRSGQQDAHCDPCGQPPECGRSFEVYLKTTGQTLFRFRLSHLLRPGNRHARSLCSTEYRDHVTSPGDTFDIRDGRIVTSFPSGMLYLVYYKQEKTEDQYQMVPDNHAIGEYIKAFIKYKLYEQLYNTATDETFNQVERKYHNYRQECLEAFVVADAEVKKQTIYQKINSINRNRRSMAGYHIP